MLRHTFYLADAAATRNLGMALAQALWPGAVVLLIGPLGAGKTTLVQGIAAGLGIRARVHSPTFTLIHEYDRTHEAGCPGAEGRTGVAASPEAGMVPRGSAPRPERLVHMDFYRLSGCAEARALGLDDYLGGGDIVVIEWPERAEGALPEPDLRVSLAFAAADQDADQDDGGRYLSLEARGEPAATALAALLARSASAGGDLPPAAGDGSGHD